MRIVCCRSRLDRIALSRTGLWLRFRWPVGPATPCFRGVDEGLRFIQNTYCERSIFRCLPQASDPTHGAVGSMRSRRHQYSDGIGVQQTRSKRDRSLQPGNHCDVIHRSIAATMPARMAATSPKSLPGAGGTNTHTWQAGIAAA